MNMNITTEFVNNTDLPNLANPFDSLPLAWKNFRYVEAVANIHEIIMHYNLNIKFEICETIAGSNANIKITASNI